MKIFLASLFSIWIGLALPGQGCADLITLAADVWCPYNCEPGESQKGFVVDVAVEVFERAGHEVEYITMPWSRAIIEGRNGRITAIVGAYATDAPGFVFPPTAQGVASDSFFVAADSTWTYDGMGSLGESLLGAVQDYAYGEEVSDYIELHKADASRVYMFSGEEPVRRIIKMLLLGRIDVAVENDLVMLNAARKMGVEDKIKRVGSGMETEKVYIAFSPAVEKSKIYSHLLSEGIQELRESGELTRILGRYGLSDWE